MVDFNVTYYDWKNNGKLIDSLFTEKNIISKFDTVSQLKKKLCVYVGEDVLKKSISLNDLYLWVDDNCSPFIKNGKKDVFSDTKNDDYLLYKFTEKQKGFKFTTIFELKNRLEKKKDTANWVSEYIEKNDNSSLSKVIKNKSQIKNIKENASIVGKIESLNISEKVLPIKRLVHTMIFADIVLSNQNKGLNLDLEKIFQRFPLNINVPLSKLGTKGKSKTKIYKPALKKDMEKKFWKKWQQEDDKEQNLQFKFMSNENIIQVTIYKNSGISVRCSGSITRENWKSIYKNIIDWVIKPINNINTKKFKYLSYEKINYRLIKSRTILKKNVNINSDINNIFSKYIPYFSVSNSDISNEGKINFIKISDYLKNRVDITNEIYSFYGKDKNIENTIERLGILFMISDEDVNDEIENLKNDKTLRYSRKPVSGQSSPNYDENIQNLGYSIKFRYDSEYIKIIHNGNNLEEIEFAINVMRKVFWLHRNDKSKNKKTIKTGNNDSDDSDSDSDSDLDALIANVDDDIVLNNDSDDSDSDSDSDYDSDDDDEDSGETSDDED